MVDSDELSAGNTGDEPRFRCLLAALILLIISYPFHNDTPIAYLIFAAINSVVVISAAFTASGSRRTLLIAVVLSAPVIFLEWLLPFYSSSLLSDLRFLTVAFFYGYTIYHVLGDVLRPGPVTKDKIAGAIAAYMLIAVAWAALYGLTDNLVPGSFSQEGQSDVDRPLSTQDLLFFSFTTLTTTGYGDITPITRHAQSLSILEQMAGTFYVAILIARLASLYRPDQRKPRPRNWRPWRRRQPPDIGAK
ncbi:MAG: ion channel [Rhodospirillales bacterium]